MKTYTDKVNVVTITINRYSDGQPPNYGGESLFRVEALKKNTNINFILATSELKGVIKLFKEALVDDLLKVGE